MPDTRQPAARVRRPAWLRVALPSGPAFAGTRELLAGLTLHTVCQSARCPNIFECFSRHTAAFLILGDVCTRSCAFCNIARDASRPGPVPPDPDEPERLARAARELGLGHVVVTSVTRDDLPDGGAGHYVAVLDALRAGLPRATREVLIPDFQGCPEALARVLAAQPDIVNHNVETVPSCYAHIRPQARYERSLELLRRVARAGGVAKSGLMVGLGETDAEVEAVLRDLAEAGCRSVTIGQYLQPTRLHLPPQRYVRPEVFEAWAALVRELGIDQAHCAPLVRSSYHAADFVDRRPADTTEASVTPASCQAGVSGR